MFRRFAATDLGRLQPKRICLIKPSALGDVVQTIPLLPVLKKAFPEASISWVINRELRDLIDGHPALFESIPFDRRGGWRAWATLLSTLRQRRFDLTIDLQGLLRSAAMTAVTGAPVRVGLETAREGASLSVNCTVPNSSRQVPAHARNWRLAEVLGMGALPREVVIATSSADRDWAASHLSRLPRPIFAVHPGARWETKRWPVPSFAGLVERARHTWSGSFLILGSKAERPDAEQLERLLAERFGTGSSSFVVNLAGQSTLKQVSALLGNVDFAISNDSGPMHLAAGFGTPTLGLFTCTSAVRSGPAGERHELVSTTVACAAGYHKTCPHRGAGHLACLSDLSVERVWLACQRLVQKNGLSHRAA